MKLRPLINFVEPFRVQKFLPYLAAIIIFIIVAIAYCNPVLEGKVINQSDVTNAIGQQAEINKYQKETGKSPLWSNGMFSGMPSYQIYMGEHGDVNIFHRLGRFIRLGLPRYSVDIIFLYMLGFFVLALVLKIDIWISLTGSLAFAFSSYNIIYIEAGHVNKALAISMIPIIIAGVILAFREKKPFGFVLFTCGLGIQIAYNHFQITYYTLLIVLCWGCYNFYYSVKDKQLKKFLISAAILAVGVVLSILPNLIQIAPTYEYLKVSSRGGSELSTGETGEKSQGLDKDYAFAWSNEQMESFTLLIPNFKGGASVGSLSEKSHLYSALKSNNVPKAQAKQLISQVYTYWGAKNTTSGPFYFGAIVVFFFVFGMFILKGKQKWWIFTISILAILWSWGENFYWFSSLSFDYFPLFNKFRVPETFLVITSFTFPLLAILAISNISKQELSKKEIINGLKKSLYITGGLLLFFILFAGGLFGFESKFDAMYLQMNMPAWFIDAVKEDRGRLLRLDAFRSLIFIGLASTIVLLFINNKMKHTTFYFALALLILVDLWGVDRRYLSKDDFIRPKKFTQIQAKPANLQILEDKDPHYRVFSLNDPFNSSYNSNFHKSIGGYHAAKIARYDDIIQYHLQKQNIKVLNMLNTKYVIVPTQDGNEMVQYNSQALGNAWFTNDILWVNGANEEIEALNYFDPATTVVIDQKYKEYFSNKTLPDSLFFGEITLSSYHPEVMKYNSKSETDGFAVFSEIYYNDNTGWKAYIDGEHVPHIQVNYILRGLFIPAGEHQIVFKFEPQTVYKAKMASGIGSLIVLVLLILSISYGVYRNLKPAVKE